MTNKDTFEGLLKDAFFFAGLLFVGYTFFVDWNEKPAIAYTALFQSAGFIIAIIFGVSLIVIITRYLKHR
ncbi:Uncharacterised protein [uncultured archaeon]|nr:Uncharacterised protein [uncultured archaeon]